MNPVTICSRFRRCGVYQFNPDDIDCSVSIVNLEKLVCKKWLKMQIVKMMMVQAICSVIMMHRQFSISPEKVVLFQQKFKEGYDLPDDKYIKWLHETYPESIMNCTASAVENGTPGYINDGAQATCEKLLLFQWRFADRYDFLDESTWNENHPGKK